MTRARSIRIRAVTLSLPFFLPHANSWPAFALYKRIRNGRKMCTDFERRLKGTRTEHDWIKLCSHSEEFQPCSAQTIVTFHYIHVTLECLCNVITCIIYIRISSNTHRSSEKVRCLFKGGVYLRVASIFVLCIADCISLQSHNPQCSSYI